MPDGPVHQMGRWVGSQLREMFVYQNGYFKILCCRTAHVGAAAEVSRYIRGVMDEVWTKNS